MSPRGVGSSLWLTEVPLGAPTDQFPASAPIPDPSGCTSTASIVFMWPSPTTTSRRTSRSPLGNGFWAWTTLAELRVCTGIRLEHPRAKRYSRDKRPGPEPSSTSPSSLQSPSSRSLSSVKCQSGGPEVRIASSIASNMPLGDAGDGVGAGVASVGFGRGVSTTVRLATGAGNDCHAGSASGAGPSVTCRTPDPSRLTT